MNILESTDAVTGENNEAFARAALAAIRTLSSRCDVEKLVSILIEKTKTAGIPLETIGTDTGELQRHIQYGLKAQLEGAIERLTYLHSTSLVRRYINCIKDMFKMFLELPSWIYIGGVCSSVFGSIALSVIKDSVPRQLAYVEDLLKRVDLSEKERVEIESRLTAFK